MAAAGSSCASGGAVVQLIDLAVSAKEWAEGSS